MTNINDIINVLSVIQDEWIDFEYIKSKVITNSALQGIIINLEKIGFLDRESDKPLSNSSWRISKEGKAFLKIFERHEH